MIYELMKKKIAREGLTEQNKKMLDVYYFASRITEQQYKELLGI